jgi:hypothetical protein
MIGVDEFGVNSVGVAICFAWTMRSCDSGAVCRTVPVWPSLMPDWVSRINGCPPLDEAAKTDGAASVTSAANSVETDAPRKTRIK